MRMTTPRPRRRQRPTRNRSPISGYPGRRFRYARLRAGKPADVDGGSSFADESKADDASSSPLESRLPAARQRRLRLDACTKTSPTAPRRKGRLDDKTKHTITSAAAALCCRALGGAPVASLLCIRRHRLDAQRLSPASSFWTRRPYNRSTSRSIPELPEAAFGLSHFFSPSPNPPYYRHCPTRQLFPFVDRLL